MALLIAIGSLTAGVIIGVVATYRFSSTSPVKVRQLEQQIEDLQQTHKAYRENVSTHFNTTAELIQQMTESYKDVYQHLASGAQSLCDHEVADKMLPAGERDRLFREDTETTGDAPASTDEPDDKPEAPRDYADRSSGGGALSEDYGLGKSATGAEPATGEETSTGAKPAGAEEKTEYAEESEESHRQAGETTDPDAPYRKPATTDDEEQHKASGDAVNTDTESTEKDSVHKG